MTTVKSASVIGLFIQDRVRGKSAITFINIPSSVEARVISYMHEGRLDLDIQYDDTEIDSVTVIKTWTGATLSNYLRAVARDNGFTYTYEEDLHA